jgi:two-component system LytT family sensor kinase
MAQYIEGKQIILLQKLKRGSCRMLRKKKKLFFITIIVLLVGCICLIWLLNDMNGRAEQAQNGILDLSQWDGEEVLSLSGDWDFFWERFMDENALSKNPAPDLKVKFPSVWNNFVVNGKQLGGMGFATYRLHVTGVKEGTTFGMRILPFSTAYDLCIDNERVASSGQVSTAKDGFIPRYQIQTVTFMPERDEFDIILHISNFIYARGGAWYTIYFGNPEKINRMSNLLFGMDFFVTSCLLLISVYSLILFFLRHDKGDILLLLLCIAFIGRTIICGDYLINYLFPSIRFLDIIWINYITLYWLPVLVLCLIRYMYPGNISLKLIKLLFLYAAGLTVLTLLLPIRIFTEFIYAVDVITLGAGIYGVVKMILLAVKRQPDAIFISLGGGTLTICIFHDELFENNLIKIGYTEWSSLGFLVFAILLQCIFGVLYDRKIRESKRMLIELNKADERERRLELQYLKSQIRPHFINNALNAIISISRTDMEKSRKLLIEFSKYLQNCYMVQNLDDKVPIQNELSYVHAYVALEQARYPDTLHVEYDVDDIFLMVPPLILQPLAENAIIHGVKEKFGDGYVRIYVKDCDGFVKAGVTDNGIGIDPEQVQVLLSAEQSNTGIGIFNINRRMKRFYNTGLYLENRPGGGTDAYIIIPKEGEVCCGQY